METTENGVIDGEVKELTSIRCPLMSSGFTLPNGWCYRFRQNGKDLFTDDLYAEDYASTTGGGAFTGIPLVTTNNILQIRQFVRDRLSYADTLINS